MSNEELKESIESMMEAHVQYLDDKFDSVNEQFSNIWSDIEKYFISIIELLEMMVESNNKSGE